jgi:hypothetical protein
VRCARFQAPNGVVIAPPSPKKRFRFFPALAACLLAGCQESPGAFVDGPESADLAGRIAGHLVVKQGRDTTNNDPRILALSLPDLQRSVVRKYSGADRSLTYTGWVEAASGPDQEGRIAFVEETAFQSKEYVVKSVRLDGADERELFRSYGRGLADTLSLSPSGSRIAYVGDVTDAQMPGALLETGPLQVRDQARGKVLRFGAAVVTQPPSWFPDSKRLALVELVPKEPIAAQIQAGLGADPKFLSGVENWQRLPVIYVLDVETGEKTYLHVGWRPLVSIDGRTVLFRWGSYRLIDVATRTSRRTSWPGRWLPPIALLPGGLLIYPGLPTRGTEVRRIKYGSFSVGSVLGSIKVADLETGRFQTLIEYADPREKFSFGRVRVREAR